MKGTKKIQRGFQVCILYRGTAYHYAFEVTIDELTASPRHFHILMTKHRVDRPYVYGGLCLDNGLLVNTNERERAAASYDIIEKIVNGTLNIEKVHAEQYPSQPLELFKNILREEPEICKRYSKRMKNSLSFNEYDTIRRKLVPLWEKPKYISETTTNEKSQEVRALQLRVLALGTFISILPHCAPIIYDCKEITRAFYMTQKNPLFNNSKINYRRV